MMRGTAVPSGRQKVTPGTLLRGNRARWTAGRCHLERFRGKTVPGGRRERLPGTLSRGNRARWEAGKATWNAFAGKPCQVDGKFIRYGTGQRNENENHGKSFTFRG